MYVSSGVSDVINNLAMFNYYCKNITMINVGLITLCDHVNYYTYNEPQQWNYLDGT